MRNFNGSYLDKSYSPGGRRTKMKNPCSSAECKCSPPIVNVHHYQCPLMKIPCPLHGYPFVYNLKSKKTPSDQCLVISFHPSLKNDKLFEPVKTFLNQTCEPDTKINFQYYSPRLSETHCEDLRHRQVQTNLEDFKKLNSCFVEKTKTFFSDKTNKMKKLKQCFNSPCSSVVYKSRSCTAIREKIDRGDVYRDKSKLEKRLKAACCMKSEESSHFLYKRDFDLSDGEKSSKEKIDSDFIAKINNNLLDHDVFEIGSRKCFNERVGRVSANMRPHFTYTSFVSPDPVKEKVQGHTQKEEVSDLERTNEESQNPNNHFDELKEEKEEHGKASPDGNVSSESSGSVYFTPYIFVPAGNDKEVEHQGIQTVDMAPKMSCKWVQTIEYFQETVSNKNQTEKSEILVAKTEFIKTTETQTPPIFKPEACICGGPQMTPDEEEKEKPDKTNVAVQTPQKKLSSLLFSDFQFFGNIETLTKATGEKENSEEAIAPVSVGIETQEKSPLSTAIYYEPEMKFLRRDEEPEDENKSDEAMAPVSVGTQTQETPILSTVVYYEPEMKFLIRKESSKDERKGVEAGKSRSVGVQTEETTDKKNISPENEKQEALRLSTLSFLRTGRTSKIKKQDKVKKPKSVGTQTQEAPKILSWAKSSESVWKAQEPITTEVEAQSVAEPVTVIYFDPETKPLRRKDENEKRGVLFNEETQMNEIETGTKDKSVGTEPETLEDSGKGKYDSAHLTASQNKEIQANSDSDTSQSLFNGSDASNVTYVVKSYITEESEQVVVKNWNKSRSDGDMLDKKKCDCLMKADQVSPRPRQCDDTNPNGLTFVGVYHSKKEVYTSPKPEDSTKAQLSKPEETTKKKEDNNASLTDLSDLIRIIDENFKKMFDRTIEKCECQQMKESKPTADKEVMTDIFGVKDGDVILQMATRPMANAQIQDCLPNVEEMPLGQSSNPDQEAPTSVCKKCSKVISITSISDGTNTPGGGYIQTKVQEVDMGTYCENFPIESKQEASGSKPESIEKPSTSKGKSGEIKSVRMSTKTFVTKIENPPVSSENRAPAPTRRRKITYPEPFSDSTASLQRDLRRAQQECGVKPRSSRPTPSPRSRPTPQPRQTQLPQSRPQVVTRLIPDAYCGNIVATITTRRTPSCQIQERCPFEPPSTNCENVNLACPVPPRPNPNTCQRTQPQKEPNSKQNNHMTYHVTLSPLWSKDIMKIFQRKLKKISKSESSVCLSDSSGKQKRNHDAGSDGSPILKRIKSSEREKTNISETNQLEHACFEFKKSQADILLKFLMKGENELVLQEESPQLTKDSGFVWVPSSPTPQFFSIRQVSSSDESAKSKEVSRRRTHVLSKIREGNDHNNSSTKDTCQQNLDCTGEKNLTRKLFKCPSCKSLTYLQLRSSEIMENPQNNSANFKSSVQECFKNLVFTSRSRSLDETDEQIYSEQKHSETIPSAETNIPSSGTEQTHKFLYELYSKFLSEMSESNFEMDLNQVETCQNSELASSNPDKGFNTSRSNKSSFRDSSPGVSNSKKATESESCKTFQFCAESNTRIPGPKKTILKKIPSKVFQGSKRKSKQ